VWRLLGYNSTEDMDVLVRNGLVQEGHRGCTREHGLSEQLLEKLLREAR